MLSPASCSVRALLESAIAQQGEAVAAHLHLWQCPEGVFGVDPTLAGVAVGNLLGNALCYSPSVSRVELSAVRDEAGLRIRVADQGPGMGEEELGGLGTPYFRGAASLCKKGSGLGYHFTRRIVEAHSGRLSARSGGGVGLEVEIFLPV